MSGGLYSHTTRANGLVVTAAIYNGDHQNHITNLDPIYIGMHSDSTAEFRATTDPGGDGSESLPTNLAGELERIRYCLARIVGKTYWYEDPEADLQDITDPLDLPLGIDKGGTGQSLSDPGADRLLFWDDSEGKMAFLTAGTGLTITGTTITATGGSGGGHSYFRARSGSNQAIGGSTTRVNFGQEQLDPDGKYDPAQGRWTPAAGPVLILANVVVTGIDAGSQASLFVYKNGSAIATTFMTNDPSTGSDTLTAQIVDLSDGDDYYEIWVGAAPDGTFTVVGGSNFSGIGL